MTIATTKRIADQPVPLLDEPPLDYVQAVIMKRFAELGRDAYGYKVLEWLTITYGAWIHQGRFFEAIERLAKLEMIKHIETWKEVGSPSFKIYELTPAGRAALMVTTTHHQAIAAFLADNAR